METVLHVEFVVALLAGRLDGSIIGKVELYTSQQRADVIGENGQVVIAVRGAVFVIVENASYAKMDLAIVGGEIFTVPYGAEFTLCKDPVTETGNDGGSGVLHPAEAGVADVTDDDVRVLLPLTGNRGGRCGSSGFVGVCEADEKEGSDDYCIQTEHKACFKGRKNGFEQLAGRKPGSFFKRKDGCRNS